MTPVPHRIEPGPGQESVWDYPRPPAVVPSDRLARIEHAGRVVAESRRALRVLETAGAPTWYLPREDVRVGLLVPRPDRRTVCEWKGEATYFDLRVDDRVAPLAAWTYEQPRPDYRALAGHIAFYAGRVDAVTVDGERARPQPGGFYGGWVTDDVVGPFKGEPGTGAW
jgi:uncharacterized protein (DUF427 family)